MSKDETCDMADYLTSLVGEVAPGKYEQCSNTSLFRSFVVGTPSGNWFHLRHLKKLEENGLPRDTAVMLAQGLISSDEKTRQSTMDEIHMIEVD